MGDVCSIPFFLFPLSFPCCPITDDVVFVFSRNQHASDDVLCVEAQVGIQHGIQLLGKIDGDHDEAERDDILHRDEQIRRFQNDDDCMVFVGNIAAAGLGITLTAASTMVFYSLDYSMSNFEQAKARIHRVSQRENCHYIYLVAKGTVDTKVLRALRNKVDLAKMLVDDYRNGSNPFSE